MSPERLAVYVAAASDAYLPELSQKDITDILWRVMNYDISVISQPSLNQELNLGSAAIGGIRIKWDDDWKTTNQEMKKYGIQKK